MQDSEPQTIRILGIDPGYNRCGFAVIKRTQGASEKLVHSSCFTTPAGIPFEERLVRVGHAFTDLVKSHEPTYCAIEKVYFTSNQKTAMHVAEVRGMLLYLARTNNLTLKEYTPNEIKSAVAGDGRADKKQVMFMVKRLLRLDKDISFDDEYDAIAAALTASAVVRV